ncbi:acylneuraminate cytidylyltransferase family protein [Candidatus Pelagibacter ubique]|nr:acylneuraminate cytidylyltransferase family protein [Candidatus Pelagibacter ubique]
MFLKKKVIALIPAKSNSSGLPRKNYLKLNKQSLFEIAIKSAQNSKFIDTVFVSSDSTKILQKSKKMGAEIIKRNKNLCLNETPANKVILDAIKKIKKKIFDDFIIIYLQPTSPFRNHHHINKAFNYLKKHKLNSIISVTSNLKTIYKCVKIKNGFIKPIFKDNFITSNRQKFETTFYPNGAIYIFNANIFLKNKTIPIKNSLAYEMPKNSSHDIDNLIDYKVAKKLSKNFLIYK